MTLMPKGLQPARPSVGSVLGLPSGGGGATAGPTGQVWAEACRGLGAPGGRAGLRRLPAPASLPSVFGHISFRSDWELVKVDFRPWFSRRCGEGDYGSWDLTNLQVGPAPSGAPSPPADSVPPGCCLPPHAGAPAGLAGPSGQPGPGSAGTPRGTGARARPSPEPAVLGVLDLWDGGKVTGHWVTPMVWDRPHAIISDTQNFLQQNEEYSHGGDT